MDLLVEKNDAVFQLSTMGIIVKDVKATMATPVSTRNDVNFKNGKLFYGTVYSEKTITVTGAYYADSDYEDLLFQDNLNALFASDEPLFITRMYSRGDMYDYQRPGETTVYDIKNIDKQLPFRYGWRVVLSDAIDYDFQGKSDCGLLTNFTITLVTADVPYGITTPENIDLTGIDYIEYCGTADCSQVEWPFTFVLTSNVEQAKTFKFKVDNQEFVYTSDVTIKKGDVFQLKGTSFLLNGLNINDKTNIQYFVLKANDTERMALTTDFKGSVLLNNKTEFYV